ncbi:Hint domain-containing protein [Vannielia litorea]|uniref:Hint domain-containing protein n=1 Tax=Vannielia litorea TaxID=1217970 RepID=A0A1N6FLM3_9RHOB|nr:Hint domain-containing protein [Vannielia litorea]SIN96136.1 Hint domain-containing protein [Vannielia litorea]
MSDMTMGDLRRAAQVFTPDLGPAGISASARILTARGERRLGDLEPGERIISRTSGMIRLAGLTRFDCEACPIALAPHALGNGRPSDLVHVSPAQKLLLRDWRAKLLFGSAAALAPAAALVDNGYITRTPRLTGMEMVTLHFDAPQILYIGMLECAFEPDEASQAA